MLNKIYKTIFHIILVLTLILNTGYIYAEGEEVDEDSNSILEVLDDALTLDIQKIDQNYPSKRIGFRLTIKSQIDSGRVAVQWYYPKSRLKPVGKTNQIVTVIKGSTYTTDIYFDQYLPEDQSNLDVEDVSSLTLGAKVSAVTYERNVLAISKKDFIIDGKFQILPITDTYRKEKVEYEITNYVRNLGIIGIVLLVLGVIMSKFVSYINAQDGEEENIQQVQY